MPEPVRVTLYNDAGCPWGYSANPAFRVLEWRYGAQLEWRLVLIGLTNVAQEYVDRGYTPLRSAEGYARRFRRFGMPLAPNLRARIVGTGRSCRAIVAVRLQAPGREFAAFRALQFAFFTTTLLLDEDEDIATALRGVDGIDVDAVIAAIDTSRVEEAYQQDRAEARTAAGSPTELQDKHATTDGPVRYTAPSVVFEHAGRRLEAGGWQPVEAYDVLVANLIPDGERRGVPDEVDLVHVAPRDRRAHLVDRRGVLGRRPTGLPLAEFPGVRNGEWLSRWTVFVDHHEDVRKARNGR